MKKIFRNIMTLMTVPFMLMTSACESMDDTNVDPTRMNTANAGSFLDPLIYGMGTYTWTRYNSWTFQLMQCLVTTNSTSGVAGSTSVIRQVMASGPIITNGIPMPRPSMTKP